VPTCASTCSHRSCSSPSRAGPPLHTHYDIRLWERYWNGAAWSWVDTGKDIRGKPVAIVRGDVAGVGTSDLRINL
jgi:hypothetical protein